MKKVIRLSVIIVLTLAVCFQSVNACTIEITPLRKEFKQAKSVFVGKVISVVEHSPSEKETHLVPKYLRNWKHFSKVTFEIMEKWKGNVSGRKEYLAVAYFMCGCPGPKLDEFKEGQKYLVFAETKNFVHICSAGNLSEDHVAKNAKRLNRFWFRVWANLYPF
jgi:hypothetical protein